LTCCGGKSCGAFTGKTAREKVLPAKKRDVAKLRLYTTY
jgi:hypothetical protein